MDFRFNEIRENNDLKQYAVAKLINETATNYQKIETEVANIKLKKLNLYCNVFKCSMDYAANLTNKITYSNITPIDNIDKLVMSERLSIIEKEQNMKPYQMAQFLGIVKTTYYEYKNINSKNLIQTLMVKKISATWGYSMDWIVGRSQQKFIKH